MSNLRAFPLTRYWDGAASAVRAFAARVRGIAVPAVRNKPVAMVMLVMISAGALYFVSAQRSISVSTDALAAVRAGYFEDRIVSAGVADLGRPIEGFNAFLLTSAFPGLEPKDFENVQARGGHYEARGGRAKFVRERMNPISSAEQAISEEGYTTLLRNVSARMGIGADSNPAVDAIISRLRAAGELETRINEGKSAYGVRIIPLEVLEDGRCTMGGACAQAGMMRVRALLLSGIAGEAQEVVFTGDEAVHTGKEEIALVRAAPEPRSKGTIRPSDYIFYFRVQRR